MANTVKIIEITDVDLFVYKTNPPILAIHAEGIVPSLGYTNGRLIPHIYVVFPPDGIWDFSFVADEPEGMAANVLAPIAASYMWPDYPKGLKGVRIHAANNTVEKKFSEHKEKILKSKLAGIK